MKDLEFSALLVGHRVAMAGYFYPPYEVSVIERWIQKAGGELVRIGDNPTILLCGDDPGSSRLRVPSYCVVMNVEKFRDNLLSKKFPPPNYSNPLVDLPEHYGDF